MTTRQRRQSGPNLNTPALLFARGNDIFNAHRVIMEYLVEGYAYLDIHLALLNARDLVEPR